MSELLETLDQGVLTLTINRPEAFNTINLAVSNAIADALQGAANNPEVRCVVLTGAGRFFSTGGDVNDQASGAHFDNGESDPAAAEAAFVKTIRQGANACRLLHEIPKPTLAIMPGAAAGAGLALALACDLRFCLDTAKLTTAFVKVGISGDSAGAFFLSHLVGVAKAKELYFTGDVITGREALEIGLVTKIANADTFAEDSLAYAHYLASLPTVAIGYMKQNFNAVMQGSLSDFLDLEAENLVKSMMTEDHKRAAAAFVNKEPAKFVGR